jgi:autoinducer 2-degrading protein
VYVIIAPVQMKEGHKEEFVEALVDDARGAVNDEPGCLRFDVIQDSSDPNRLWVYEVYRDEAAFQAHLQAPHFIRCQEVIAGLREEGPTGAGRGSHNIWPPDGEFK